MKTTLNLEAFYFINLIAEVTVQISKEYFTVNFGAK